MGYRVPHRISGRRRPVAPVEPLEKRGFWQCTMALFGMDFTWGFHGISPGISWDFTGDFMGLNGIYPAAMTWFLPSGSF